MTNYQLHAYLVEQILITRCLAVTSIIHYCVGSWQLIITKIRISDYCRLQAESSVHFYGIFSLLSLPSLVLARKHFHSCQSFNGETSDTIKPARTSINVSPVIQFSLQIDPHVTKGLQGTFFRNYFDLPSLQPPNLTRSSQTYQNQSKLIKTYP